MQNSLKVLIAEDDAGVREGLVDLISDRATVVAVSDLEQALAALAREPFGLVIADMKLGGEHTGGRMLVEQAQQRGINIIVMTGMSERDVSRTLQGLTPNALLPKPFSIDFALSLVDRFLERA